VIPAGPSRDDLDTWVRESAPRAVAFAHSLLRDRHLAEDVVQDCYCSLLAKAGIYDLPRDGMKLLFKAISNACINVKMRRRGFLRLVWAGREDVLSDPPDLKSQSPELALEHADLSVAVANGLANLPPIQRASLELKSLGHSLQEIADILNISSSNAGVLIHRARRAMEKELTPYLKGESV